MKVVPWRTLLVHAPTILDAARKVYGAPPRVPALPSAPADVRHAVEALEQRGAQQAELLADLAQQVQAMTTAIEVLRARMVFALIGSGLAAVMALVALVAAWRS